MKDKILGLYFTPDKLQSAYKKKDKIHHARKLFLQDIPENKTKFIS